MARTIRTKVYKFDELSEDAKQTAIDYYRNNSVDTSFIYDDAHNTVKEFHNIFDTKEGNRSWLDVNTDGIEDNVLELTGLRLQKYIWNNYKTKLYKGKYFSLWSKTEKSYKHYKEGYPVLKSRHSKVILDNCCVLTGICYDNSLLQPMYDFLERYNDKKDYYSYMTFETLINDCFESLQKDIENEESAQYEDENIIDNILANEYEFTADGRRF